MKHPIHTTLISHQKNTSSQKGFTLIELLITIAIIGILSGIVIAGVGSSRQQARDVTATAEMNSLAYEALLYYREKGRSYDNLCTDTEIMQLLDKAKTPASCPSGVCASGCTASGQKFRVYVELRNGVYYCVDSKRFADTLSTTPPADSCK